MHIVVHEDNTGFAPADCQFYAIDDDTYDGAEDSSNRNMIGYGRTEAEAIADLMRLFDEADEEAAAYEEHRAYFDQHNRSEP